MVIRLVTPGHPGHVGACEGSWEDRPDGRCWRPVSEARGLTRAEVLREQYLKGTLFFDEYEVARRMLLKLLVC